MVPDQWWLPLEPEVIDYNKMIPRFGEQVSLGKIKLQNSHLLQHDDFVLLDT